MFDVYLQDQKVLSDVTIDPAGNDSEKAAVHSFDDIMISDQLRIRLVPKEGKPVISGVELTSTKKSQ